MTLGHSAAEANAIVNALDGLFLQIHVGDPGAAGTANQATETTRKAISLAAAAGGSADTDADLEWPTITCSEDPTHFSLWTLASGGTFKYSGLLTSAPYTAGDTFRIAAGALTISHTAAA